MLVRLGLKKPKDKGSPGSSSGSGSDSPSRMGRVTYQWRIKLTLSITTSKPVARKEELLDRMSIILDEYQGSRRMRETILLWYCLSGWLANGKTIEGGLYQYTASVVSRVAMNYSKPLEDTCYPIDYKYRHEVDDIQAEDSILFTFNLEQTKTSCCYIEAFIMDHLGVTPAAYPTLFVGYGTLCHVANDQIIMT